MAKLLLLLVVLSIVKNYQVDASFGMMNMFGAGDMVRDVAGEINHVIKRFSGPNEKYVKDQANRIEQIKKNIAANNKTLNDADTQADSILSILGSMDDSQRELDRSLIKLNDTFTLVDLKIELVMDRLKAITMQLNELPIALAEKTLELLENFADRLRTQRNLLNAKDTLKKYIRKVDISYRNFLLYTRPGVNLRSDTMDQFTTTILSPDSQELSKTIMQTYKLLAPGETASIYNGLLVFLRDYQSMMKFNERCDLESSFQEQYRELYNIVLVSEVRAFTMQVFAINYRYLRGDESEGALKNEVGLMIEKTLKRISGYLDAMKRTMKGTSREIFRCEPKKHLLGETSFRLNSLFGTYYISKQQLNPLVPTEPKEINTLSYFECLDRYSDGDAFISYYCPRYQCAGRLHKCKKAGSFKFCEARVGTNRRYSLTLNGNKFPTKPYDCNGRYIDTLSKTNDNLLCQCSEEGAESLATRTISLKPQLSDIDNNMVITNVHFIKKNNMVHLQVEEGLLLPEANIDMSTVSSVSVGNFRYLQNSSEGSYGELNPDEWDDKIIRLTYDLDYTFLSHNRSTINLDDIVVDPGYVVTGVKFDTEENNPVNGINTSPIQLKVHGTPFDYNTGLLVPTKENPSKWFTPIDMKEKLKRYNLMRESINIEDSDDSIKNTAGVHQSPANYRVTFQVTSWEKDMGQTVVPYFDTLPAAISNKVALNGVGIFHRGSEDKFGGFIAPKIFTVDHSEYINPGGATINFANRWQHSTILGGVLNNDKQNSNKNYIFLIIYRY